MQHIVRPEIFKGNVTAFFTGRRPGIKPEEIALAASVKKELIYMPVQKHTGRVFALEAQGEPVVADAVLTSAKGVLLGVQVADCAPILLYDGRKETVCAVHAGWRGTAEGILKRAIDMMRPESPGDILIAVGPAIRWCCYEVGEEVLGAVSKETGEGKYHMERDGKICLDLPSANKTQAHSEGVPEENIWMSEECTFCLPERFYSYRFSKGHTGRQGGFIGMPL